jgi:hypothetical protein
MAAVAIAQILICNPLDRAIVTLAGWSPTFKKSSSRGDGGRAELSGIPGTLERAAAADQPVALVLGVTVAGFFGARLLGERDARRESRQAEVAAAQIRGRVEQGAFLADGLRRYMVGVAGRGVTSEEFASNSSRWLSPAGFPVAAWVEQVPALRVRRTSGGSAARS